MQTKKRYFKYIGITISIIIGILFLLYTLLLVMCRSMFGGDDMSYRRSLTMQESLTNNSFVAEYEIEYIPDSTKLMLSEVGMLDIIEKLDIWLEKGYRFRSEYFYFNRIEYNKDNYLVFINPREILETVNPDIDIATKVIAGELPDFDITVSDHFFSRTVVLPLRTNIPDTLHITPYFKYMHGNHKNKFCGVIKLKLKYLNPDPSHIDKRPIWKRLAM